MFHRERFYYLHVTITIDRPYFRDEAMSKPAAFTRQSERRFAGTDYAHAVRQFEALLDGDEDFSSEYTAEATLVSQWSDGTERRTVRKTVHRVRKAFTFQVERCATEREQFDIRMAAKDAESAGELATETRPAIGARCFTNAGWATVEAVRAETVRVKLTAEGIGQPGVRGRIREPEDRDVFEFPSWCVRVMPAAVAAQSLQKCGATNLIAMSA
jgi:autotransporter translocation and assembly factor TamB